mmetsp:Transcript_58512/g.94503  ORF Transcript_58512/g.94503 Transcript_58512/m.94503 type:complete len:82 (+) Transcript_58512:208-453(+)
MIAVFTATVTLSFVFVFVLTSSCVVRMETDATVDKGHSTKEQPGGMMLLNLPHSCTMPLSAPSTHAQQRICGMTRDRFQMS